MDAHEVALGRPVPKELDGLIKESLSGGRGCCIAKGGTGAGCAWEAKALDFLNFKQ